MRERVTLDWARTMNDLGGALQGLGERESGTARLQETVSAYREALKEWTREQVPAFDVFIQAGHEQYRTYFEDRLQAIGRQLAVH